MEYLNLTIITLAFLGMLIHMLMFVMQKCKGDNKFSFKVWIKDKMNWMRLVLSFISTLAIILMLDDIAALFGVAVEGHGGLLKLVAFSAGYFNHSFIKNILKMFKKSTKTNELKSE